jgi:hypothetical protein
VSRIRHAWLCDCDCGQEGVVVSAVNLAEGRHHCGCGFTGKSKNISLARKRGPEKRAEVKVPTPAECVVNNFLYKYRWVEHEASQSIL